MESLGSAPYNKYESLRMNRSESREQESSWSDVVFGKDTTEFETLKDNFLERTNKRGYRLRQDRGASKTLDTLDGTMWTGKVFMGTEGKAMDVIFDNASDWLVVEGSDCPTCEGNTYDISTSSEAKQVGFDYSTRAYGNV